jgi:hypothetical protein
MAAVLYCRWIFATSSRCAGRASKSKCCWNSTLSLGTNTTDQQKAWMPLLDVVLDLMVSNQAAFPGQMSLLMFKLAQLRSVNVRPRAALLS